MILCADDYGLSDDINHAILDLLWREKKAQRRLLHGGFRAMHR